MREYKIVELKNGHGDSRFQIKTKHGWGWFTHWCDWDDLKGSMKSATDTIEEAINEEKKQCNVKVKEYVYTTVPNHVPEDQAGKFMEISLQKK
jgi:hypothetical protein